MSVLACGDGVRGGALFCGVATRFKSVLHQVKTGMYTLKGCTWSVEGT